MAFQVWVEVEETDANGDKIEDHSPMLDGASVGTFDDLDSAINFGNAVQSAARVLWPSDGEPAPEFIDDPDDGPTCPHCGAAENNFGISVVGVEVTGAIFHSTLIEAGSWEASDTVQRILFCRSCDNEVALADGWDFG